MTEEYFKIKEEISGDNEVVGKFIDSEAYIILDLEDACDVLNALHEENYKLKKEIGFLQSELHNCYMDVRERTLKEVKDSIKKLERFE